MKHEDSATIYEISQSEHGVNVENKIVVSADLSVKLFLHQNNFSRLEASSMRGSCLGCSVSFFLIWLNCN